MHGVTIMPGEHPHLDCKDMATPAGNQHPPPPIGATVHIYRGLMDRATTWRARIDNPTNWAILTCGTSVSFVLSDPSHSHAVLLLVMLMALMFLSIEARRTRYYDLWSSWLRLLETEYYAPILQDNCITANDTWHDLLVGDLGYPHFKVGFTRMVQRRLRDHYMAIFLFVLVSWLLKLLQHPLPSCQGASNLFVCDATLGPLPGFYVLGGVLCLYAVLVIVTLLGYTGRESSIEVLSREGTLLKLVSPLQQPVSRRFGPGELLSAASYDSDGVPVED
jgi:uncharacterized membrane protein